MIHISIALGYIGNSSEEKDEYVSAIHNHTSSVMFEHDNQDKIMTPHSKLYFSITLDSEVRRKLRTSQL